MAIIAVAGGLGQVGRALVDGLVRHGHKVLVLTRKVSDRSVDDQEVMQTAWQGRT